MSNARPFIVEVRGVTHTYRDLIALSDVGLEVPAGCMAGLIGPDGVGKSTLLGLMAGVRKIQSGEVQALGASLTARTDRRTCVNRIAFMPQGLGKNLYPTLSIYENLEFFGRLFGQSKAERDHRIAELLAATGLSEFADRPAGKLSGGMKQKLGLCCTLIHDPDLLILDEPTTGVDPLSRRQFWQLIAMIRKRRPEMSVIVATAYMEEAELFDWLAALDDGRVIATGTPAQLISQTGKETLETAFISLLPEDKRAGHTSIVVPPRTAGDGTPAIQAEDLTMRFGDFTAVDNVSFEIERGEIFGFLGSNGCGKTTTMKMLTGLLEASEGEARLFGTVLDARDMTTRRRVGYMSQSFSLYGELSVEQNLLLHAQLFDLGPEETAARIEELVSRFELAAVRESQPQGLPLGIKQRLQLAVAVLHRPEVLILDEPTSGVDPIARDDFWRLLIELSRDEGVTIFISTHFMNEAERCDRISLMHAGKVLAVGEPEELIANKKAGSLDEAFVGHMLEAIGEAAADAPDTVVQDSKADRRSRSAGSSPVSTRRIWAYASREGRELSRDPVRLAFALLGPIILMITFSFGISFDVEDLPYAVLDQDRSVESRQYLENFAGSRYFEQRAPITSTDGIDTRLRSGELKFAIEVPSGFGKQLLKGQKPQVGIWLDGAMPFRAETARGYIQGVTQHYLSDLSLRRFGEPADLSPALIETRFRYNQSFESTHAITPGVIMLLCVFIPAMMTAVGIVREKELGSITNLHATPVTKVEFLLGKQLPYVMIAYISFLSLTVLAVAVFGVPLKGSLPALFVGALVYVWATTGFGMLVSSFVNSQIAAIFAAAILTVVPTLNFSGFLSPVSAIEGGGKVMSAVFPATYFQQISIGSFTKALGFADLWRNHLSLLVFALIAFVLAALLLRKQDT
ncbi:MAG: ribosome-associated ATPase/putative transporter RbbA [Pseudomonadota bacterium]